MTKIYSKLYNSFEIGDDLPTVIMGVLNLSPESFYKGSVYEEVKHLETAALEMIKNGARMLDIGARSTAPWSRRITVKEEIDRIIPAMEVICKIIPDEVIISVDTQYKDVAQQAFDVALRCKRNIMINDVSCLKIDPSLMDFIIENDLPIVLMASRELPGDLCAMEEIISESEKIIKKLINSGYDGRKIIIDPGIGHWIEKKVHIYDLKIISMLEKLRILGKPILVAISRKSFIGTTLGILEPENRYNGTLSATVVAVYNGAHIVRTHDVNDQLLEMVKMAEELRKNGSISRQGKISKELDS